MTVRRDATEWGTVYPYAPDFVHPFLDREYAELHSKSTGSILMQKVWVPVEESSIEPQSEIKDLRQNLDHDSQDLSPNPNHETKDLR